MLAKNRSFALRPLLLAALAPLTVLLTGCGGPNLFERMSSPYWGFGGTLIIVLDLVALVDLLGDEGRSTSNRVVRSQHSREASPKAAASPGRCLDRARHDVLDVRDYEFDSAPEELT